jgi:hypothetical protein
MKLLADSIASNCKFFGLLNRLVCIGFFSTAAVFCVHQPAKAILPVLSVQNTAGGFTNDPPDTFTGSSSFGYYFDLNGSTVIDALGLFAQETPVWTLGDYAVTLYSYDAKDKDNLLPSEVSILQSVVFSANDAPSYLVKGEYFWQPIPMTTLVGTPADDAKGYILGVNGLFTNTPPGQLLFIETPPGDETFNYGFIYEGNGSNNTDDPTGVYPVGFYPVPAYLNTDPNTGDPINGYFNPNLSVVPGPLPVLGTAAGFSWSRRLRKRIRVCK